MQVVESPGGSLADLLTASRWTIRLPAAQARLVGPRSTAFLAADAVPVERMTKKGLREFDCRAAVVSLAVRDAEGERRELDLVLRHTVPAVRPDDVLTGLAQVAGGLAGARRRDDAGSPDDPLGAGSAGRDDRLRRRPARAVRIGDCLRVCDTRPRSTYDGTDSPRTRPDDVLAGPPRAGTVECDVVTRPRRGPTGIGDRDSSGPARRPR